jgi:hypothetical protein
MTFMIHEFGRREHAVTEIRFGSRTQTDARAACGHAFDLTGRHMRCMHEAPALIHLNVIQQPLDGPRAGPLLPLLDFRNLLRDVYVHGPVVLDLREYLQLLGRDGAQAMSGNVDVHEVKRLHCSSRRFEDFDVVVDVDLEALLRAFCFLAPPFQRRRCVRSST